MICKNCGTIFENSVRFCARCGTAMEDGFSSTSAMPVEYNDIGNPARRKMGGWLLFIVVVSIVLVVIEIICSIIMIYALSVLIGVLVRLYYLFEDVIVGYYISFFSGIFGVMTIVFQIIFIYKTFKRSPTFLRFAQLSLFAGIIFILLYGIGTSIVAGSPVGMIYNIGASVLIGVYLLLFTMYMSKSIRVHEYMGNDKYMDKAIFTFRKR